MNWFTKLQTKLIIIKNKHPFISELIICLTATGITVGLFFLFIAIKLPHPIILLVPFIIAFTTFFGYFAGGCSTLASVIYAMYFFSSDHSFFKFTSEGLYSFIVALIGLIFSYVTVSILRFNQVSYVDRLAKINKFLELDNQQLQEMSISDSLTRTKNRFALRKDFDKYSDEYVHVMMFDIDNFKNINDKYGHSTGDYVLKCIGGVTKEIFGVENTYRYGGDEFLIIVTDMENHEFKSKVKDLKQAINEIRIDSETTLTRFSGGCVYGVPSNPLELRAMIRRADKLLYEAKDHGKDDVRAEEFDKEQMKNNLI